MRKFWAAVMVLVAATLSGCGYNDIQRSDEQVKSAWSEVLNQYQRRADLIPNLVNTVKGFAAQEQQVLTQVTEARSRVGSIQATPELINDPAAFRRFQEAQGAMSSALGGLENVAIPRRTAAAISARAPPSFSWPADGATSLYNHKKYAKNTSAKLKRSEVRKTP